MKYLYIYCFIFFAANSYSQQNIDNKQHFLSEKYYCSKNYKQAVIHLTKAIKTDKANLDLIIKRGEAYYQQAKYEKAIKDFEQVEALKPGIAAFNLARSYAMINNTTKSIKYLNTHLKSRKRLPKSQIRLDSAFNKLENTIEWAKLWTTTKYSKYEMLLSDAAYNIKYDKQIQAFDALDNAISKYKNNHQAYYQRAKVYIVRNNYKDAINDLTKAINKKSNNREYITTRAKCYEKLHKYKKALDDYNKVIQIFTYDLQTYFSRSQMLEKLKQYDNALTDINLYLEYYPTDDKALYHKGIILCGNDDYIEALKYFNRTLKLNPNRANYFTARADAYFQTGTYKYANQDYTMALDLTPRSAKIYHNRALARLKLGNKKGACSDWKNAKRLGYIQSDEYIREYCLKNFKSSE